MAREQSRSWRCFNVLIDGTFSPSDVAKEISTHKKEQEEDRTLSLRIQRNADWIKQQNKEID
jgi:hypothetical protein